MNRRLFLSQCGIAALGLTSVSLLQPATAAGPKKLFKKGVGLTAKPDSNWKGKLKNLNLDWHYSWGLRFPEEYPEKVKFVPMTWGKRELDKAVHYLNEQKKAGTIDCALGFNEPDQEHQSNISVELALELWPTLMKADVRLGGPACVHPDNDWMREFMKQADARKLRVDFVPIHDYGGPNPGALVNKCKRVYEMYGRPVWITEFGVGDWQAKSAQEHRHGPEKVLEFLQGVLPELDKLDFVEKYAWFSARKDNKHLGTSALFHEDGTLTALGRFYANYNSINMTDC